MNLKEILLERRTIHKFSSGHVDENFIDEAIKCAVHAPNHRHTAPWRFFKLGSETKNKLINLNLQIAKEKNGGSISKILQEKIREKYETPAWLIVVGQCLAGDSFRLREDYAAVACGIQNFSLYLHSKKFGTKWSTGSVIRHSETYKILNIDPKETEIVGFIWVGVPKEIPQKPPKVAIEEVTKKIK